jgi:hypothetical protein
LELVQPLMGFEIFPADTNPEAAEIHMEILRRLPPVRRLEMVFEMNAWLRELLAAGVRQRHPEYSDEQVRLAVIRLWLGEHWFREVYPGVDVQP